METASSMSAALHAAISSPQESRPAPEARESMSGPDNDADRDDQIAVRSTDSTPAVNAMGETVGQLIDVSA